MVEKDIMENIYVFLTPFHLKQISEISELLPQAPKEIVFYSEYVEASRIKEMFPSACLIAIPQGKVKFKNFFLNPFSERNKLNKLFLRYKKLIDQALEKDQKYNLIIGQDKDVFIQILINQLIKFNLKNEVIAVDEGTAFYSQNSKIKYPIMKFAYTLLSPIVFKNRIRYVERLGTLPEIDTVYARFSDELKKSAKTSIKCIQIPIKGRTRDFTGIKTSQKVLILTGPLSEDNLQPFEQEQKILSTLLKAIPPSKEIHIKQHPRENEKKLAEYKRNNRVTVLNKKEVAETLKFEEYALIIHYGSSVIMDLYLISYPLNHVVTLNPFAEKINLNFLFDQTNHIKLRKSRWEEKIITLLTGFLKE
jgi:hypothetical protein